MLEQLSVYLPAHAIESPFTYIEPFVGGGAMLFYMLQHFGNIRRAVINDVNEDLILAFRIIKEDVESLIISLSQLEKEYHDIQGQVSVSQQHVLGAV